MGFSFHNISSRLALLLRKPLTKKEPVLEKEHLYKREYTNLITIKGFQPRTPIRGSGGKLFSVSFSLGSIDCVAVSIVEFTYSRKIVCNFLFIRSGIHIKSS